MLVMMDYVSTKLSEWGLAEYIQNFHENGLDEESFLLIDCTTAKELIGKLGPRLKFLKELDKLKFELKCSKESAELGNISINSSLNSDSTQESFDLQEAIEKDIIIINEVPSFKRPLAAETINTGPFKKLKSSIFPQGLEELLRSSTDGKIVLMRKGNFNNDCRQKLVKEIMNHLLQHSSNNRLAPELLSSAADEIVELFPEEKKEAYYIPYTRKPGSAIKLLPQGKLYSKYVNIRKTLKVAEGTSKSDEASTTVEKVNNNSVADQEASYAGLLYLTSVSVAEIINSWRETYELRMQKQKQFKTAQEYFNTFPSLQLPDGYKLLVDDFNVKYKNKGDNYIYKIWPDISRAIICLAIQQEVKVAELNEAGVDKDALSVKLLPWLFQATTVRNHKKKINWRPSRLEVQDSFLLHIQTPGELQQRIEERRAIAYEKHITLQPFLVAVGPLNAIEAFYAVVDKQIYKFENILTAIDVTFKIFFALNLEYPAECRSVWQTIDAFVYKIEGNVGPAASVVIADIEKELGKINNE